MYGRMRMGIMGPTAPGLMNGGPTDLSRFQNDSMPDPLGDINAINTSLYMGNPGPGMSRIAHGRGKLGPSAYI